MAELSQAEEGEKVLRLHRRVLGRGGRHTAPAPQEACSLWVNVRYRFLPVLWQKSPSCPRTTARPTAAPSGRLSASSSRSSSWAGSTLCASAWCVSATPGPTGPSRMSTSVGPPTCPSISSPPAAPSTVPSQVRTLGGGAEAERAGYGASGSGMVFGLDLRCSRGVCPESSPGDGWAGTHLS